MNGFRVWIQLALLSHPVYCFLPHNLCQEKGESHMVNKLFTLLFASVLVFPLSTVVFAQEAPKEAKAAKPARWEGIVIRVSKDQSTLTVRNVNSTHEKTVQYDNSTKWVSQEHGSKKVSDIDSSQVKDGDRVITEGTWDKDGVLHATVISKRLTKL
jgi:hypothetical protein